MSFQMIRVISSPSISTTGLATLIFAMTVMPLALSGYSAEWMEAAEAARVWKKAPPSHRRPWL
jgi:hypothetical protein